MPNLIIVGIIDMRKTDGKMDAVVDEIRWTLMFRRAVACATKAITRQQSSPGWVSVQKLIGRCNAKSVV